MLLSSPFLATFLLRLSAAFYFPPRDANDFWGNLSGVPESSNSSSHRVLFPVQQRLPDVDYEEGPTRSPSSISIAQFIGDSFVKHANPEDLAEYLALEIHFKTNEPHGLLYLEMADNRYLALFLDDGYATIQFSRGVDSVQLRSQSPISTGTWHKVEIWRTGRGGLMKVEGQEFVENRLDNSRPGSSPGFSYFGGVPDGILPLAMPNISNFHGCIRSVILNAKELALLGDAIMVANVHECGENPCSPRLCLNQGDCVAVHDHYMCLCSHPFHGRRCQLRQDEMPSAMSFNGASFLQFKGDSFMQYITGETLNLTIRLRIEEMRSHEEKTLAFAGDSEQGGDFFHLLFTEHRQVRLLVDLGSGVVSLTHPVALDTNGWHTVMATRTKGTVSLAIDSHLPITATAPDGSEQLNVYDSIFFGGRVSRQNVPLSGIVACITEIRLAEDVVITSPASSSRAINIAPCNS